MSDPNAIAHQSPGPNASSLPVPQPQATASNGTAQSATPPSDVYVGTGAMPAEPPEGDYLVEELVPRTGIALWAGLPKTGKTHALTAISAALAGGVSAMGEWFETPGPERVLAILMEGGEHQLAKRLNVYAKAYGVDLLDNDNLVIPRRKVIFDLRIDDPSWQRRIDEWVRRYKPAVVIVDSLASTSGSWNECTSSGAANIMRFWRTLANRNGISVLIVHHHQKGASASRPGAAIKGSGRLWAESDVFVSFFREKGEDSKRVLLRTASRETDHSWYVAKLADGPNEGSKVFTVVGDLGDFNPTPSNLRHEDARQKVLETVRKSPDEFLSVREIRRRCGVRNATIVQVRDELIRDMLVEEGSRGVIRWKTKPLPAGATAPAVKPEPEPTDPIDRIIWKNQRSRQGSVP